MPQLLTFSKKLLPFLVQMFLGCLRLVSLLGQFDNLLSCDIHGTGRQVSSSTCVPLAVSLALACRSWTSFSKSCSFFCCTFTAILVLAKAGLARLPQEGLVHSACLCSTVVTRSLAAACTSSLAANFFSRASLSLTS